MNDTVKGLPENWREAAIVLRQKRLTAEADACEVHARQLESALASVGASGEGLLELIGEYWCLAYAEGREGRDHDTEDGAAQRKLSEIKAAIRRLSIAPQGHGGGGEAVRIENYTARFTIARKVLREHGNDGLVKLLDELADAAMGYTTPPTPSAPPSVAGDAGELPELRNMVRAMATKAQVIDRLARVDSIIEYVRRLATEQPTCPECKAVLLYECPACSASNYPKPHSNSAPVVDDAERGTFYVCPTCKGPGVVTRETHDAALATAGQPKVNHLVFCNYPKGQIGGPGCICTPDRIMEMLSKQPGSAVQGEEITVEAVGRIIRTPENERRIDWLIEGGVDGLEDGETLCIVDKAMPDDGLLTFRSTTPPPAPAAEQPVDVRAAQDDAIAKVAAEMDADSVTEARGVEDVIWRIDNEAAQFVDAKGMIYLRYLRGLLSAAPEPVRVDERQALVQRAIELAREMEPWDGKTYNEELAATLRQIAALSGKDGAK